MRLKTLLIAITIILGLDSFVAAQTIKFGILAGGNISDMLLAQKPNISRVDIKFLPVWTVNINGYLGFKSKTFWGVSVEPGFIQKASVYSYWDDTKDDNSNIQLNCLQVPINIDLFLSKQFSFSIGPEFSYAISSKYQTSVIGGKPPILNNKELSGNVGLTYSIFKKLDIGLRYNHGLTCSNIVWHDDFGNVLDFSKEYNQRIQFFVRFLLKS
jgi:hypothetical protein